MRLWSSHRSLPASQPLDRLCWLLESTACSGGNDDYNYGDNHADHNGYNDHDADIDHNDHNDDDASSLIIHSALMAVF